MDSVKRCAQKTGGAPRDAPRLDRDNGTHYSSNSTEKSKINQSKSRRKSMTVLCSGATKWMWADERRGFKDGWSRRRKRDDDDEEVELNDVYTISKAARCVRIEWRDC